MFAVEGRDFLRYARGRTLLFDGLVRSNEMSL